MTNLVTNVAEAVEYFMPEKTGRKRHSLSKYQKAAMAYERSAARRYIARLNKGISDLEKLIKVTSGSKKTNYMMHLNWLRTLKSRYNNEHCLKG